MDSKREPKEGFTDEEKLAMEERAKEIASGNKKGPGKNHKSMEKEVMERIALMSEPDLTIATNLHRLIKELALGSTVRTWYGMPAYEKNGSIICFFQERSKFKTRYATVGFSDKAQIDDGYIWPTSFAVLEWNKLVEERLRYLIGKAFS
ncbi:MAG: hypothetical protein M1113_00995 [Candidatus Thermoplasmatota archaeon]|nr:hypothetical protein [Candidatus Thermoplasmatota archaeon]